jgi:hypothetical protein
MKTRKIIIAIRVIYILLLSFVLFGCCSRQEEIEIASRPGIFYKEYLLTIEDTNSTKLCILNTNKFSVSLIFQINDKFWFSKQQLIRSVLNTDACYKINADEKIYKAWIFTLINSVHQPPFDLEPAEINNPLVFFNSDGRGYCYNRAVCLAKLWVYLGFQSRIVHLGGHAVPEVFEDKKWKMFDPDNGIFYKDSLGNIASVDEIAEHSNGLIMDTGMALYSEQLINILFNKEYFLRLFTSEKNNVVDTSGIIEKNTENPFLTIPPGARFEYPVCNPIADSFDHGYYCRLNIPAHYEGWVSFPFIIDHIEGNGFMINSKKIIFPGKISNPVASGQYYLLCDNLSVYAYINPMIVGMEQKNKVKLVTDRDVPVSVFLEKTEVNSNIKNNIPEINKIIICQFDKYQSLFSVATTGVYHDIKSLQDFKDYVFMVYPKTHHEKNDALPGLKIDYLLHRIEKEEIDTVAFINLMANRVFTNMLTVMIIELSPEQISQLYMDDLILTLKKMHPQKK